MLAFLGSEALEDATSGGVPRQPGRAGVKVEAALLGVDCHAQRVAREEAIRERAVDGRRLPAGAALFTRAENLDDRVCRREMSTAATSSSEASTSELTNSDDRWQVLHTRWK